MKEVISILADVETPGDKLRALVAAHNEAVASLTPQQLAAVDRVICASLVAMVNTPARAVPSEWQANAEAGLIEVMRQEVAGRPVQTPMWPRRLPDTWAQYADRYAPGGSFDGGAS